MPALAERLDSGKPAAFSSMALSRRTQKTQRKNFLLKPLDFTI
jgi:hypothetical protein